MTQSDAFISNLIMTCQMVEVCRETEVQIGKHKDDSPGSVWAKYFSPDVSIFIQAIYVRLTCYNLFRIPVNSLLPIRHSSIKVKSNLTEKVSR